MRYVRACILYILLLLCLYIKRSTLHGLAVIPLSGSGSTTNRSRPKMEIVGGMHAEDTCCRAVSRVTGQYLGTSYADRQHG